MNAPEARGQTLFARKIYSVQTVFSVYRSLFSTGYWSHSDPVLHRLHNKQFKIEMRNVGMHSTKGNHVISKSNGKHFVRRKEDRKENNLMQNSLHSVNSEHWALFLFSCQIYMKHMPDIALIFPHFRRNDV